MAQLTPDRLVRGYIASKRSTGLTPDVRAVIPVCSAIESGSYKNALLLVNKLIKRSPTLWIAHALKTVCLAGSSTLTSSDVSEITATVEHLESANKGSAMKEYDIYLFVMYALDKTRLDDVSVRFFSKGLELFPNDEFFCLRGFSLFVKQDRWVQAQQLALKMSKTFAHDARYTWWSIISMLLRARDLSSPNVDLLLSLAERQLSTALMRPSAETGASADVASEAEYQPKLHEAHEYQFATRLLELMAEREQLAKVDSQQNGKTSAVKLTPPKIPTLAADLPAELREALLQHLESPEADYWCRQGLGFELDRRKLVLRFGRQEHWLRCREKLIQSLKEGGDTNWHTMLSTVNLTFALIDAIDDDAERKTHIALLDDLFSGLAASEAGIKERGYILAQLEVGKQCRNRQLSTPGYSATLVQYFDRFGSKMCCFDDLVPYLADLTPGEISELHSTFETVSLQSDPTKSLGNAFKVINASKLARHIGPVRSIEEEQMFARRMLRSYFDCLDLGKGLPKTELQPADEFAVLAIEALCSAFDKSQDRAFLEQALLVADRVLRKSAYKYQARLLYVNIARLLGAPSLATAQFSLLRVRSIQFDTLSHVLLSRSECFAIDAGVQQQTLALEHFYPTGEKEAEDVIAHSFEIGSYSKIEEFIDFKKRLDNSLMKPFVSLTKTAKLLADVGTDSFADNRDYKTVPNWQPGQDKGIWEVVTLGPKIGINWIKTVTNVYEVFLAREALAPSKIASMDSTSLTNAEARFVTFAHEFATSWAAATEEAREIEAIKAYFADCLARLEKLIEDEALPFEQLHEVMLSFEAFCLLDAFADEQQAAIGTSKSAETVRLAKRLKAVRTTAREGMRPLSAKLTAYGKQVGKSRARTADALAALSEFEQLDHDARLELASSLTESRKQLAEGVASLVHKRIASLRV